MNLKNLILLAAILLLLFAGDVRAQKNDVSVNLSTGTANVNIPLYTLSRGRVSLPITLNYSATGIKPKDVEGSAGMGWNVSAGGQISRELHGLPDDIQTHGWIYNRMDTTIANFTIHNASNTDCTGQALDSAYVNDNFSYADDTEPDIFYVSAPGLSCKLVYDNANGKWRTIPYMDIKVDTTNYLKGIITSFTITSDQGIKYVFDAGEYTTQTTIPKGVGTSGTYFQNTYHQYSSGYTFFSTWYLTSMKDANGNGVLLHYSAPPERSSSDVLTLYQGNSTFGYLTYEQYAVQQTVYPLLLDTIRTTDDDMNNNMLTFSRVSNNSGFGTGQTMISEIQGRGRDLHLDYTNVIYYGGAAPYYRFFLTSFTDLSQANSPVNRSFTYYGTMPMSLGVDSTKLSDSTSYQHMDYWGYYTSNSTLSPSPAVYVNPSNPSFARYEIKPSGTVGSIYSYFLTGLEQVPDLSNVMIGSLKSVSYAQGGKTTLTYESNDYVEPTVSSTTVNQGGGIRIKTVQDSDIVTGLVNTRNYSYINPTTGVSSGKPLSLPAFGFSTPYMGTDTGTAYWNFSTMRSNIDLMHADHTIMYEYARVSQSGAGSTLYQYSLPATNWDGSASPACSGCGTEWHPTMDYTAHMVCVNMGAPINDMHSYPFAPDPNYDFERGLPLKVTTYNEAGTPQVTSQTKYTYTRTGTPGTLTGFKWERNETNNHKLAMLSYAKYLIYYGTSELTDSVVTKVYDTQSLAQAQSDTTTYTYGSTYHKLASQQTANSDHSLMTTNYKYTKDYTGLSSGNANANIDAIYQLQQLNVNTPTESWSTVTRGATTTVTSASLTLFKGFPGVGTTLYMPAQQWQFVQPDGGGSFSPVSISGSTLTKDSRYLLESNFDEYDFTGVIQTADNAHRDTSATLLDHISYHPAISVKNAAAYEVAFQDFDSDLIPAWTEDTTVFSGTKPAGSHVGKSHGMNNAGTFAYTIQKSDLASNYVFSIWIRSSAGGSFGMTMAPVSPSTGTSTSATCTFASTGSAWKYFEWKLPMPVMSSGHTVKVTATLTSGANIGMDDILLYPESAEVATYAYNDTTYFKIAQTNTNGVSAYFQTDVWGRPLYQYDQDHYITARVKYNEFSGIVPVGFVTQDVIKVAGIKTDGGIDSLTTAGRQTTIQYHDGLGRPLQSVGVKASPLRKDMIQPAQYNTLGQQTASWLPYVNADTTGSYRSSPFTEQAAFYLQTGQYLIAKDSSAYSQQVMEKSPLQRVLEAGMAGAGFQPTDAALPNNASTRHFKNIAYRSNNGSDATILGWGPDGSYVSAGYSSNTLAVTIGRDEDSVKTITYTDLAGHTVLKRQVNGGSNLDTYYIYNQAGMISIIVPPKAVAIMVGASNYSLTSTGVPALLFRFTYNAQGQLTRKQVPGKGPMSIIYDPLNRPVLMQDSNMTAAHNWNYIKYDVKGRAMSQGIYTDATHTTPAAMQSYVTGLSTYNTYWFESRSTAATTTGYYTNNSFPTSSTTALAYSYNGNYSLNGSTTYAYGNKSLPGEVGATTAPIKGMPTMTLTSTVGSGMAAKWLLSVVFYDHNLRPVQTQSNNLLNYTTAYAVTDTSTTVPDFTGASTVSLTTKNTGTIVSVQTTPTYDEQYRVKALTQRYNGGTPVTVAQYNYNELGQATNKGLGVGSGTANITLRHADSVSSTGVKAVTATTSIVLDTNFIAHAGAVFSASIAPAFLQQVDYRFNIRGQLQFINNSTLTGDSGHTEQDSNSVFGMELLYNTVDGNLNNTALFNGNLSAVKWMTKDASGTNGNERAYKYTYDAVDRYTKAEYAYRTGSGSFTNSHGWDEAVTSYDENGNIQHLNRKSPTTITSSGTLIDSLTYTYSSTNANQLYTVADATGNNLGFGIYAGGSSGGNYSYDANGNMTHDGYKDMNISYNVINRTDVISLPHTTGRNISYIYTANGNMIRKIATDTTGGTVTTTDYIDGFVYVNTTLSYFPMPEGRMVNNGGNLTPQYVITDQQGNARVTFDNTGSGNTAKIIQENSYYGFGMVMPGSVVGTATPPNKNLYNGGSEIQNDFSGLPDLMQTFYRNYDAALGRWVGVDPEAESAESMSVYQYAGNNPIMGNDPLGNLKPGADQFWPAPQQALRVNGPWNPEANFNATLDMWGSDAYQDYMYDLGGGNGVDAQAFAKGAQRGAVLEAGAHATDLNYAIGLTGAYDNAVMSGHYSSDADIIKSLGFVDVGYQTASRTGDVHNIIWNRVLVPYDNGANQGGYPGFKEFADLVISESSTKADAAGIAGVIISRLNAVGASLNDPNWVKKIGTKSAYDGYGNGIYAKVKTMTIDAIASSKAYGDRYAGILQAFNNWGTDFTEMPGHTSYYWTAKGLTSGYAYDQWVAGNMVRNTIDGTTFYAFKNPSWQWTP